MASSFTISQRELKRKSDLAYDNKAYRVFLANNVTSLTEESNASAWLAIELATANGYAGVTGTVGTGSGAYNGTTGQYEFPRIVATFTASGAGFTFNTVVLRIATEASVAGIFVETPPITLLAGQSKTYSILLGSNN